eukprot:CAMPEP_0179273648 /NCGR_PEP_ID=MMETSP0797-20121207/33119_1 /TAXON_ID=47934 /ORGANISM="Dinophysis acuminata, Strain DAEP01" /LENGTH=215 /DNA_ID=CAMNT_0020982077 /DNA_START=67 /DNA_END=714 /DNA_ORIENTATION=-
MSLAPQHEDALPYTLLLKKTCTAPSWTPVDDASTAEPDGSPASSLADGVDCTPPAKSSAVLLHGVSVHGPHGDGRVAALVRKTRELSDSVFHEDGLLNVTRKSGWRLTLLVSSGLATLCGFLVSRRATSGGLAIAKLAVPTEFRGLGFGKLLMEDAIKAARRQGLCEVGLSALPTAVTFYQHLGFKALTGLKVKDDENLVEGQVCMLKKLGPRRR